MQVIKTNQPGTLGDLIHWEVNPTFTTEDGVLLAGSGGARVIDQFTVIAQVTASKKLQTIDFAGSGGANVAYGVSLLPAQAADGVDGEIKYLRRGPAIIHAESLVWPAGATDNQKATALAALLAQGILAKTGI
ncbi:head decoration protein [Brevundimonas subvibrioides]|uniref:Head decoration protein n=1 Tax=Brevundimonas subvibrioides (strain ATCC 15264 / DSM 4735 / LMG 14903 / NBRC 16000 / CB 81) TaxID=633149 RepID=D9QFX9_BRESC|nr:head decoration protein [Brevundimonas subvibrioides]ADL00693.1 conserved hypothetical protein [Brevundimonas subvibrioides ATCC 15264]